MVSRVDLFRAIPLAATLGVRDPEWDGTRYRLCAPFEPNRNGHATAFAGSLTAVLTLTGWGLVHELLGERGYLVAEGQLVLQDGSTTFHAPVEGDFCAEAHRPEPAALDRFFAAVARKGRGRVGVVAVVGTAVTFRGRYVATVPTRHRPSSVR